MYKVSIYALLLFFLSIQNHIQIDAECANGCNGHGRCTTFDMCICHRNWQANDCSERICQFGRAHVDGPLGDLDFNGIITNTENTVAENSFTHPYGTTESFPRMEDSDLQPLYNSAHSYMECSNKGKCDRSTGECICYEGFEGVSCQRASCPGHPFDTCSGHGVCKSISQLAKADGNNVYKLWDKDSTMGCECDYGFSGSDCSQKICKHGVDPLYIDDAATIKYSTYNFATLVTANADDSPADDCTTTRCLFTNGMAEAGDGTWAIRFYDVLGEDWITEAIPAGASCSVVVAALEALPANVIPKGQTYCSRVSKLTPTNELQSGRNSDSGFYRASASGWDLFDSQHPETDTWSGRFHHRHPWHIYYDLAFWEAELTKDTQAATSSASDASVTLAMGEDNPYVPLSVFQSSAGTLGRGIENEIYYIRGFIYNIHFFGNPGALKEPEIELYLDGKRPTLIGAPYKKNSIYYGPKVITKVWSDGQQGENIDHFADHCDGVTVTIKHWGGSFAQYNKTVAPNDIYNKLMGVSVLSGLSDNEIYLLKKCLGESDFDVSNNNGFQDSWDYGTILYPHIIKLVRTVSIHTDGGYYVALVAVTTGSYMASYYDTTQCTTATPCFKLLNPFKPADEMANDYFEVYTTKGTLALTSNRSEATFNFGSRSIFTTNVSYDTIDVVPYNGDISCPLNSQPAANAVMQPYILHCLNKSDMFTMLNFLEPQFNPPHINLYTAKRVYKKRYQYDVKDRFSTYQPSSSQGDKEMHYMTNVITSDMSTNWGVSISNNAPFYIYKFFPHVDSSYKYVAECSNRGRCNQITGTCECFSSYTSDSCAVMDYMQV